MSSPPRGGSARLVVLGGAAVVVVTALAAGIAWFATTPGSRTASGVPSASSAPGAPSPPPPSPEPEPEPEPAPSASGSASASADPPVAPKGPPGACFARLLPDGAFGGRTPDLEDACTGRKAYPTALIVKTAVVAAAGPMQVTPAMREWSRMGWYETAAFAAMRAHCCPDAPPLETPARYATCAMETSLAHIAERLDDREGMDEALEEFRKAAICTAQKGGGGAFGRFGLPSKVELKQVGNVLDRIDADRSR